jgi:MFS transporter, DHA1 family, multidrug resistance protein
MQKSGDLALLTVIALIYTTVCMETDIYVPAFPDMQIFFATTPEAIQQILSINFIGICLGSLIVGPLSDVFGRRSILLLGLVLFSTASIACCVVIHLKLFLLLRFLQGLGAATPMVISFAIILEKYEPAQTVKICGALNLFITGVIAFAPILGSLLNIYYGWRANFIAIALLSSISLLTSCIYVPETLTQEKRHILSLSSIIKNYIKVITSLPYLAAGLICYLMFAGLVIFIANLSIIFIEYLGVAKTSYAFYQAAPTLAFALFSLLSIWIIDYLGMQKTKYTGLIIVVIGAILLILTANSAPNPLLICAAMVIYTIGITLAGPIYAIESANVFPDMLGVAAGMSNALRYIVVSGIVGIGSLMFNGSIKPVVFIIGSATALVVTLALILHTHLINKADKA